MNWAQRKADWIMPEYKAKRGTLYKYIKKREIRISSAALPMNEQSYHMSVEDFRRYGKEMIDWIADYYEKVDRYPVLSRVKPGEIGDSLAAAVPVTGR